MEAPNEKLFYQGAVQSYTQNPNPQLQDFVLRIESPTIDAYVNEKTKQVLITIRGTNITDATDLKAEASLPFNNLRNTKRFEIDKRVMEVVLQRFPQTIYTYHMSAHSLGVAILNEFKRMYPFVRQSVAYNGAFQPKDLRNQDPYIKRLYINKDFLFNKGGFLFNPKTVLRFKSKNFFDWFFNKISKTKESLSAHRLVNFQQYYGSGSSPRRSKRSSKGIIDRYSPSTTTEKVIQKILKKHKKKPLRVSSRLSKGVIDRYAPNSTTERVIQEVLKKRRFLLPTSPDRKEKKETMKGKDLIETLKKGLPKNSRVEVKMSQIKGTNMLGLFSRVNLTRHDGESGEILTGFEFEEEEIDQKKLEREKRYSLRMSDGKVFYMKTRPTNVRKLGYYSNEARGKQKANCYLTARYYKKRPQSQLRVLTKVRKGQELLWDYGDEFEDFKEK